MSPGSPQNESQGHNQPDAGAESSQRTAFQYVGLALRGAMMGIAEVIPGVSGGTIAFISGIYDELLGSIARFGPESFGVLRRDGVRGFWLQHNLGFLLAVAVGMGLALVTVARLVKSALETSPPLVWAFFFGLIVASIFVLLRGLRWQQALLFGGLGLLLGIVLSRLSPASVDPQWWMLIPGGMLAVTAWILPGISGSLMLLLMGLYPAVLAAVADFDVALLGSLGVGCVLGLLAFSRLLVWLLGRFRGPVLAVLTGVMAGSLVKLWPWQNTQAQLLTPARYAIEVSDPMTLSAIVMAVLGVLAVTLLARFNPAKESR